MKKWLLVPGVVFILILIILIALLPKPEKIATVIPAEPTPSSNVSSNPAQKSVYQNMYDQISGFTPEDPKISAPNFDRKISLPKEE